MKFPRTIGKRQFGCKPGDIGPAFECCFCVLAIVATNFFTVTQYFPILSRVSLWNGKIVTGNADHFGHFVLIGV
ncbi:hypothetical protein D3C85_1875400 [compost metagenome]